MHHPLSTHIISPRIFTTHWLLPSLHSRDAFLFADIVISLPSTVNQYAQYTDTRKLSFQFTALMLLPHTSKDRLGMPTSYEQVNPHIPRILSSYPHNSKNPSCLTSSPHLAWTNVRSNSTCLVSRVSDPVRRLNRNSKGRACLTQLTTCSITYNKCFKYQMLART